MTGNRAATSRDWIRDLCDTLGYPLTSDARLLVTAVVIVATYVVLTGIAVSNALALVQRARRRSASTIVGVLPGLLAAGCASCGAGVLGALGFVGAMAALPFDGNLLRLGGIALLLFFLGRAGDPRTCSLDGGGRA
ncbi:hypothetical protein G9464_17045 [Halostella sp. JP-L12]|uniref:hypothetical protein n=1 Tax=Halostella TaxID=1843185 RepID=UPI000EF8446F|nr:MULTISPECIES: hypothetical protein [Halostella]NHN49282.1 hypothetical protein [Halostella sp. JP-L12]